MDSGQSLSDGEILWEVSSQRAIENSSAQRSCSSQLKNIKRPCHGTSRKMAQQEKLSDCEENDNTIQTMKNIEDILNEESLVDVELRYDVDDFKLNKRGNTKKDAGKRDTSDSGITSTDTSPIANEGGNRQDSDLEASNSKLLTSCVSSPTAGGKSDYATVRETIRTFNKFYLQIVQVITSLKYIKNSDEK